MTTPPPNGPGPPSTVRSLLAAIGVIGLDAALLALALGGISPLLHHARALALLAVWGVGGIVLAWIRPVRSHDPLEVRREQPLTLIALLVIPLLASPLSALGERLGIWNLPGGMGLRWTGVVISAAGLGIRIAAMSRLGSRFSPLVAVQKRHALETRGLYARIRHPGYLGSWLVTLGTVLAFGSGLTIPLALLMWAVLSFRMRHEEELLERHFGEEYRSYRGRTGRLFPRIASRGGG